MSEKFVNYLSEYKLHNYLSDVYDNISLDINEIPNIIFYGPEGSCKYSECLNFISKFSPSKLKYEKKLLITNNNNDYYFRISDIHIEIDIEINTYNNKLIWSILYEKVNDIIVHNKLSKFIIVCKNFHKIDNELLDSFYYFKNNNVILILLTESITFIPTKIINLCKIIPVKKPLIKNHINVFNKKITKKEINDINNYKKLLYKNYHNIPIDNFEREIYDAFKQNIINLNYFSIRDISYSLLTYNINIYKTIYFIILNCYKDYNIPKSEMIVLLDKLYNILNYYNNNYRPIYHLERFFLYLIKTINEL
jgi:hypothetical protein